MSTLILTAYILVWPVISLAVLALIVTATVQDVKAAKRENRELV